MYVYVGLCVGICIWVLVPAEPKVLWGVGRRWWELNSGRLEKQALTLTAEPSLQQPPPFIFLNLPASPSFLSPSWCWRLTLTLPKSVCGFLCTDVYRKAVLFQPGDGDSTFQVWALHFSALPPFNPSSFQLGVGHSVSTYSHRYSEAWGRITINSRPY